MNGCGISVNADKYTQIAIIIGKCQYGWLVNGTYADAVG